MKPKTKAMIEMINSCFALLGNLFLSTKNRIIPKIGIKKQSIPIPHFTSFVGSDSRVLLSFLFLFIIMIGINYMNKIIINSGIPKPNILTPLF